MWDRWQDFQSAFGLGSGGRMVYFGDEGGVALAAIRGLKQKLSKKDAEIKELKEQLDQLRVLLRQVVQPQTQ